ncbi:MAG: PqqD family protein [Alphaproteobacteria bacterium]|nr:PqqD family protein [Alphaproteobacteria bacterium]
MTDAIDIAAVRFAFAGGPIVHETLDGEVVIINLKTGTYYSLQGVGAECWAVFADPATPATLAAQLIEKAALPPDTAAAAATAFVGALHAEGLLQSERELAITPASLPDLPEGLGQALTLQRYTDVQELLTIDPVHDVDEVGWPVKAEGVKLEA